MSCCAGCRRQRSRDSRRNVFLSSESTTSLFVHGRRNTPAQGLLESRVVLRRRETSPEAPAGNLMDIKDCRVMEIHLPWGQKSLIRVMHSTGLNGKNVDSSNILIENPESVQWCYNYLVKKKLVKLTGKSSFLRKRG